MYFPCDKEVALILLPRIQAFLHLSYICRAIAKKIFKANYKFLHLGLTLPREFLPMLTTALNIFQSFFAYDLIFLLL